MRIYLGILFLCGLLVSSGVTAENSIKMENIAEGTKITEGKETENWVSVAAKAETDWMTLRMTGKFYISALDDSYEDSSSEGTDDAFSRIQAAGKFKGVLEGLGVKLGDKWNAENEIIYGGIGYQWAFWDRWTIEGRFDEAVRRSIVMGDAGKDAFDYNSWQEEIELHYAPESWLYTLKLQRKDKRYPNQKPDSGANFSYTKYTWGQELKWEVNEQWKVEFDYTGLQADYRVRKDSAQEKWGLKAGFKPNRSWDWDASLTKSDYYGYNGNRTTNGLLIQGKYTTRKHWWVAAKVVVTDYQYSEKYDLSDEEAKDLDGDYRSRQQRAVALEFQQKAAGLTYNLELFGKQYDYQNDYAGSYRDGTVSGGIGTLKGEWGKLDWQLRAAPNGNLTTRKAKYELKGTYHF